MAKPTKRPALTHCKVTEIANDRAPWRVWWTVERDGKPTRAKKQFSTEEAAWSFAVERENEIANHGVRYGDIPPEARRAFDFYRDERAELEAVGVIVPRIEDLITGALAAIRRAHQESQATALTVAECVATFSDYKATRVGARQLTDFKTRLKRFAEDYGDRPMRSITTAAVESWLAGLRSRKNPGKATIPPLLGPLARNHYRATLHAFFKHGASPARGWCGSNPVADLEPERVSTGEPEAYSVKDAAALMQAALSMPEILPVLTLGMFAGLRVSEAIEVDLGKLPSKPGEFRTTGKTGPRMAPFTEAAAEWIAAQPRRAGKAWMHSPRKLVDAMQQLFKLAGVKGIDNGARHSFVTYRTAECRDVARVADEVGNSVSTIKAHYRQLVSTEAAAQFFAIRPAAKKAP
jgi:site-specific recombinase XerD